MIVKVRNLREDPALRQTSDTDGAASRLESDAGHTETVTVTWLGGGQAEAAIIALSLPPAERRGIAALTEAERHVESLLRQGCSDREIAEIRSTSVSTVQKQIGGVYRKLGVRSRAELLAET
jgi:DNA-binding CsgD family transcriptional regulator